ncbi:hypothetical protein Fmac_014767 [Flemingia macrophylla]|uniref:Uncharacterized protein n=1 Tax=Flemingia macrophylla TaxID=520843 RepID=A0ABD1MCP9_9FABA
MIREDCERVSKKILPPLLDSRSDGMKFTHICQRTHEFWTKWLTVECYRMSLLHKDCPHGHT